MKKKLFIISYGLLAVGIIVLLIGIGLGGLDSFNFFPW